MLKDKKIYLRDIDEINGHDDNGLDTLRPRLLVAAGIIIAFVVLILGRLWFLQISNGEQYISKAYNNRVRVRKLAAPRGHILDRNGLELVTNRPSFNVVLIREDSKNDDVLLQKVARVLKEDVNQLWDKIRKASNTPRHVPIVLKEDIDWETLAYFENHKFDFSGIRIEVTPRRVYHDSDLAAHVIGYPGAISKEELARSKEGEYDGNDQIGKMGLERLREKDLRGDKGTNFSEVNNRGFEQRLLKREEPLPGRELHLTLDANMQKTAEKMMHLDNKAGAVIAIEVNSGRILTLVSTPGIRLDEFIGGISTKNWKAYLNNPRKPLLNKTVQGTYPPGSTYKMITALAGLQNKAIDENTVHYCPGFYTLGNRVYRCWNKNGHGAVNLKKAIAESCDVYFYLVGQQVGVDVLAEYARKFGLGKVTGLEIEGEKRGVVPTKEWKRINRKEAWQEGETLNIAIGQGFNLVTPLQVTVMTSMLANGGKKYLPQLVERVIGADGRVVEEMQPKLVSELKGMDQELKLIQQGMLEVVHGERGTARIAKIQGIQVAGKTGTAQVVRVAKYKHLKEEDIKYKHRDHAWFTCYAPADKPEVAVTVLVEHGLHGSSGAAPIAKAVLETYFGDRIEEDAAN